jgi:hypothetical protein
MTARSKARAPSRSHAKAGRRWSHEVKTASTYPRERLFTKDARTIAREMGSRRVSPKGIGSGIRMIQFFINRAGRNLSPSRRRVLERAKHMLQERREKGASA